MLQAAPTIIATAPMSDRFSTAVCLNAYTTLPRSWTKLKAISPWLSERCLARYLDERRQIPKSVIFHGLSNINLPFFSADPSRIRHVVTIHDLIPLLAKEHVSFAQYVQSKILLPRVIRIADRIIVISEWTRQALLERYPKARAKVVLIRNGVPDLRLAPKQRRALIRTLTVARSESYKRIGMVGEIARLSAERMMAHVVTDQNGEAWLKEKFPELLANGSLLIYVNLNNQQLRHLYQDCDVYVHPSLFEGHALPAGDALSFGMPVVYCRGSGIDELCGSMVAKGLSPEAAADEWLDAIVRLHEKSQADGWENAVQNHYKTLGSWKDCGKAVKLLYDELLT